MLIITITLLLLGYKHQLPLSYYIAIITTVFEYLCNFFMYYHFGTHMADRLWDNEEGRQLLHSMLQLGVALHGSMAFGNSKEAVATFQEMMKLDGSDHLVSEANKFLWSLFICFTMHACVCLFLYMYECMYMYVCINQTRRYISIFTEHRRFHMYVCMYVCMYEDL